MLAFAVANQRSALAADITWTAVVAGHLGQRIGTALVGHVLAALRSDGVAVVEVKSLDRSAGHAPYLATCAFWGSCGFVQLETIDPLPGWRPGNPSAIYVAALAPTRPLP